MLNKCVYINTIFFELIGIQLYWVKTLSSKSNTYKNIKLMLG